MKFSTALFALSSAVGALAVNSFTTPIGNETLHAGDTFIIRWNNTNGGDTIDLFLKKGNASNLQTALTISTGLKNVGAVRWFLPEDLYTGTDYALQITNKDDNNDINYSPFFTIIGKDPVTTTSTTSSSTKTSSSTHSSTEASSTAESSTAESSTAAAASTSAAPNSTVVSTTTAASSFVNSTVVISSTSAVSSTAKASRSSGAASASGSAEASDSAKASSSAPAGTTTAAGSNGASALSLNNAVIAVGLAGAAFFAL